MFLVLRPPILFVIVSFFKAMEKYFKTLCCSHEDFNPYVSLAMNLNEDMELVFILDVSHPSKEELNYIVRINLNKFNTSLLALMNHLSVPELPDFFYKNFKVEGFCIEPSEAIDAYEKILDYLKKHHIQYKFVKEQQ